MKIKTSEFETPDPHKPTYSMLEIDFYAHLPYGYHPTVGNHRLSLRKNLIAGKYEVIQFFHRTKQIHVAHATLDLRDAVNHASRLVKEYWGHDREDEVVEG